MTRLPVCKPKQVIKALQRAGFFIVRQKGSHIQFHHPDKPGAVTVPNYHRDIPSKVLRSIVEDQAKLTMDEFLDYLRK